MTASSPPPGRTLHSETDLWLRRYHPAPDATHQLLCLAYAGGSASYFVPVARALAPAIDVLAVQYPGRQDRYRQPCLTSMEELADRVTEIVAPVIDRPMAIFGHSMGASLGYEIARRLTDRGIDPELLVVSGRRAPSAVRDERFHEKSDDEFIAEIGRLGGTETALLADPEVRAMVLPAVRADYRLAELYRHTPGTEPRCPVLALVGDADPKADIDEVRRWADHSDGPFELEVFPGGHFYLNGAVPRVLEHIRSRLLG
jgi:surfactin synthase thioesterase subunit